MRWPIFFIAHTTISGCTLDRLPVETLMCRASQSCTAGECTQSDEVFHIDAYEGDTEFEPNLILDFDGSYSALAFEESTNVPGFYEMTAMALSEVFHTLTEFKSSDGNIRLTLIQDQMTSGLLVELMIEAEGPALEFFAACVSEQGETE